MLHVHYLTTPQHTNPYPGGHEINNFDRLFLGHDYYTLSFSDLCLIEEKILTEIMHFHNMTYLATP